MRATAILTVVAPMALIAALCGAWFAVTSVITAFIVWPGLIPIAVFALVAMRVAVDERSFWQVVFNREAGQM